MTEPKGALGLHSFRLSGKMSLVFGCFFFIFIFFVTCICTCIMLVWYLGVTDQVRGLLWLFLQSFVPCTLSHIMRKICNVFVSKYFSVSSRICIAMQCVQNVFVMAKNGYIGNPALSRSKKEKLQRDGNCVFRIISFLIILLYIYDSSLFRLFRPSYWSNLRIHNIYNWWPFDLSEICWINHLPIKLWQSKQLSASTF